MNLMNKFLKIYRIFVFLVLILVVVASVFSIRKSRREYPVEKQRYFNDPFTGILIQKSHNRGINILIRQNSKVNRTYLHSSRNYDYNPYDLFDFLKSGDSLVKRPDSYDLYIYRGNSIYYFKLGEYINR